MIEQIKKRVIVPSVSLLDAMRRMDETGVKMLFVMKDGHFEGIFTIGDIQRAMLKGISIDTPVERVMERQKKFARVDEPMDSIKNKMLRLRAECMPVLNEQGELADVIFWRDLFEKEETDFRPKIDLPVVIMAGGRGTRLSQDRPC